MDCSKLDDGSGMTSEEKLQAEIAGDDTQLLFTMFGSEEVFHKEVFKQGVTFEWVKNKICDIIEAQYEDLSLYLGSKRIPEPFCLVDMNVKNGALIMVKIADGAMTGEVLRNHLLS